MGEVRARRGGSLCPDFQNRKVALLLIRLALSPGRAWSREELCEVLWPGDYVEVARDRLRQTLALLQKTLRGDGDSSPIETDRTSIRLSPDVRIDVHEFRSQARDLDSLSPQEAAALRELGHREFCPGFTDDWVRNERIRFRAEWLDLCRRLVTKALVGGVTTAIEIAEDALRVEPLDEGLTILLLRALQEQGKSSEALRRADDYSRELLAQFGLKPSQEFEATVLGLKQAGSKPATKSLTWVNLTRPLTMFFGREAELDALEKLIQISRLVTVTGPGGTGKTRFVSEFAITKSDATARPYLLIGLADEEDLDHIAIDILQALGYPIHTERASDDLLTDALRDRELLLILDNCEHVLKDAAELIRKLLSECPRVTVVATSRIRLGIQGERELPLQPFDTAATGEASPAVQMFADRIRGFDPSYELNAKELAKVGRLCELVEGVPLAIELAASRASITGTAGLLEKLGERVVELSAVGTELPDRHRALRNALGWSYHELADEMKGALGCLTVFAGTFSALAAEEVCGSSDSTALLHELRKRSLLQVEQTEHGPRFRMLEMVRQFVEENLDADTVESARERHLFFFEKQCKELRRRASLKPHSGTVSLFRLDLPNFRAAYAKALSDPARYYWPLYYLTVLLLMRYESTGNFRESRDNFRTAIATGVFQGIDLLTLTAFLGHASVHLATPEELRQLAFELLEMQRPLRDFPSDRAMAVCQISTMALSADLIDVAQAVLSEMEQLLATRSEINPWYSALLMLCMGCTVDQLGDRDRAHRLIKEGRQLAVGAEMHREKAWCDFHLGRLNVADGRTGEALTLFAAAVRESYMLEEIPLLVASLRGVLQAMVLGDPDPADLKSVVRAFGFESTLRGHGGLKVFPHELERQLSTESKLRDLLADFERVAAEGGALGLQEGVDLALSLSNQRPSLV